MAGCLPGAFGRCSAAAQLGALRLRHRADIGREPRAVWAVTQCGRGPGRGGHGHRHHDRFHHRFRGAHRGGRPARCLHDLRLWLARSRLMPARGAAGSVREARRRHPPLSRTRWARRRRGQPDRQSRPGHPAVRPAADRGRYRVRQHGHPGNRGAGPGLQYQDRVGCALVPGRDDLHDRLRRSLSDH